MKNFLSKVGHVLGVIFHWAVVIAPAAAPLIPNFGIGAAIDQWLGWITQAESIGTLVQNTTGSKLDKWSAVEPSAQAAVMASPFMQGKKIVDNTLFQSSLKGLNDNLVGLLKSVDGEVPQLPAVNVTLTQPPAPATPGAPPGS